MEIMGISLSERFLENKIIWPLEMNERYSVRSAYRSVSIANINLQPRPWNTPL